MVHLPHSNPFYLQKSFSSILVASKLNCPNYSNTNPFFLFTNISSISYPFSSGKLSKQLWRTHQDIIAVCIGPSYVIHQFPQMFLKMNNVYFFFESLILSAGMKQNSKPENNSLSEGKIPSYAWYYCESDVPQKKTAILVFDTLLMKSYFAYSINGSDQTPHTKVKRKMDMRRTLQNIHDYKYYKIQKDLLQNSQHILNNVGRQNLLIIFLPKVAEQMPVNYYIQIIVLFLLLSPYFNIKIYYIMLSKSKSVANSRNIKNSNINQQIIYGQSSRKSKISITSSQMKLKKSNYSSNVRGQLNTINNGKTADFYESRKESFLNSFYNIRKNHLVRITKENRKIYDRINSQKSLYSNKALNKSYDSICSNSSRVSNRSNKSKVSHTNKTSRLTSSNTNKIKSLTKRQYIKPPTLKAQNVNLLRKQEILGFHNIFGGNNPPKKDKARTEIKMAHDENVMSQIKEFPLINNKQNVTKIKLHQYTPDRIPKLSERNHNVSQGLPLLKEKTPVRMTPLQKIIQNIGQITKKYKV